MPPWYNAPFCVSSNAAAPDSVTPPDVYPQDLRADALPSANGDAPSIQVSLTKPETSGAVTGYNIYYTDNPAQPFSEWGQMFLPETGEPQITGIIRNLYPDTTYYMSSTIVNEAGEGPASFLVTADTSAGGNY